MLLNLPPAVKIYVATKPVDLRKAFDGLSVLVQHVLRQDPLSGHLFFFLNRRADRCKVLWFDGDGYALYYKRLERGRFYLGSDLGTECETDRGCIEVRASDLALILQGIDLRGARRRASWSPPPQCAA